MTMLRKSTMAALAVLGLTMTWGQPASAETPGSSYIKIEGGYVFESEADHEDGGPRTETDFDDGFVASGAYGYYIAPNLRLEGEASYQRNTVDDSSNGFSGQGDLRAWTGMATLYHDLPLGTRLKPYVGVGIGWALINPNYSLSGLTDNKDLNFAWQGSAGVEYAVSDQVSIDTRYRYLDGGRYDFAGGNARYRNHAVLTGLRFKFGATPPPPQRPVPPRPAAQPAPAPAPVAPPPVPEPAVREAADLVENVYFGFDSAELTAQGIAVIDRAIAVMRRQGVERVDLEGHTDSSGDAAYNERLAQRRAEAVRDALVARGVPADRITLIGKGERDLAVATGDGVRNPSNRYVRVHIDFPALVTQ